MPGQTSGPEDGKELLKRMEINYTIGVFAIALLFILLFVFGNEIIDAIKTAIFG